ncbi:MAG: hypothetical protein VX642_13185 [Bdellovibrionota bacterium]|nr:hypothetical protein [Bdellovibrionota bacterium]
MLKKILLTKEFIEGTKNIDAGLEYSFATTVADFEDLKDLVAKNYPGSDVFPAYYFSPQSCTIIARHNSKLVGSICIIQNGAFPLPIEVSVSVPKKVGYYRFAELTDLCTAPFFMKEQELKLSLLKHALQIIDSYTFLSRFYVSDLDAKCSEILEEMGFSCLNKLGPKEYSLRNTVSMFYYGSFRGCIHKLTKSVLPLKKDIASYLLSETSNTNFIAKDIFNTSKENFLTPDCFQFILNQNPSVLGDIRPENLRNLMNSYLGHDDIMQLLPHPALPIQRTERRYPVRCEAVMLNDNSEPVGNEILDVVSVAKRGIGFHQERTWLKKGSIVRLRIEIGNHIMSDIEVKVGAIYQGLVTGTILKKDHYWNRYNQFLDSQYQITRV